jgi:hypothetical protein
VPDDQTQQPAATALRPMRPGELLGTAFGLYRRHWRTLLAIMAVAVPPAVSFPSTKVLPGPGDEYQVIVHHRVVATGGSWTDTAIVVLAVVVVLLVFAVVVGAVTVAAAVAAVGGEDLGVRRSYRFGAGRIWPLLQVILLTWLLLGLTVSLVSVAVGRFGHGWLAQTVAQALAIALTTPFAALVGVLLYLDLRARKEPLDASVLRRDLSSPGA